MDDDPSQEPYLPPDPPDELDFFNDALAEHTDQPDQLEMLPWPSNEAVTEYTRLDEVSPVLNILSQAPVVGSETRPARSEPATLPYEFQLRRSRMAQKYCCRMLQTYLKV